MTIRENISKLLKEAMIKKDIKLVLKFITYHKHLEYNKYEYSSSLKTRERT